MLLKIIELIFLVVVYILGAMAFSRLGKKMSIKWSWVSWIPGGALYVNAKAVNWRLWALWPTITIVVRFINTPITHIYIFFFCSLVLLIQLAQLLKIFNRSTWLLLWAFFPVVGQIIFPLIILKIANSEKYVYSVPPKRSWYGF